MPLEKKRTTLHIKYKFGRVWMILMIFEMTQHFLTLNLFSGNVCLSETVTQLSKEYRMGGKRERINSVKTDLCVASVNFINFDCIHHP